MTPLDLHRTVPQVEGMTRDLDDGFDAWRGRLDRAAAVLRDPALSGLDESELLHRIEAAAPPRRRVTWIVAGTPGGLRPGLAEATPAPPLPSDYTVFATDGSQIHVDRHGPAQCYLINVGGIRLRYGTSPEAEIFGEPVLFGEPRDMVWADPAGMKDETVDEPLVGLLRTAMEARALADRVEADAGSEPAAALLDGSLVLWQLARHPEHARDRILRDGLVEALTRLREVSRRRPVAVGSYISRPRAREVTNVVRVAACPHDDVATSGCDNICGAGIGKRECEGAVAGLMDHDLFGELLEVGERSRIFASASNIVEEYEPHEVRFFYLNVGDEIARVETTQWVADDPESLDLLHATVLDQCAKGRGYPLALQEAHERAVLTGADRRAFWALVEGSMRRRGLSASGSRKARSKRSRAI